MAFRPTYRDKQAPLDRAWHLNNAAVAYKSNELGVESLKMTVAKLMKMNPGVGVNKIIGQGRSTGSARKFSFYVDVDKSNTTNL